MLAVWFSKLIRIRELNVEMRKAPPKKTYKLMNGVSMFASWLQLLYVPWNQWQSLWLVEIAIRMRQFPTWSNSENCMWSWKCSHTLDVLQQQRGKGDAQSTLVLWGPESHWVEFNVFKSVFVSSFTTSKIVHSQPNNHINITILGPLHTWAKGHDHGNVRALDPHSKAVPAI
jgi:hypothetical protein